MGSFAADFVTQDLIMLGLIAYPGFLIALYLGQKFHDKIPQKRFYQAVEILLCLSVIVLIMQILY